MALPAKPCKLSAKTILPKTKMLGRAHFGGQILPLSLQGNLKHHSVVVLTSDGIYFKSHSANPPCIVPIERVQIRPVLSGFKLM